ncbi:MAG: T9SS type A sorting domain-containing protein [Bacteroidota bacterium]|nr:T9SS type A sorting domain-containing protein [Bacteroidota bacterium]
MKSIKLTFILLSLICFNLYSNATTMGLTTSTNSLSGMNYTTGAGPSAQQSFKIAGSSLTGNVVVIPSSLFEISKTSGTGFATTSITITPSAGNIDSARIYVRLKAGLPAGTYTDSLLVIFNGPEKAIHLTGAVTAAPQVTVSTGLLSGLNYTMGAGPSAQQSFTVEGTSLTGNIVITPSARYEISRTPGAGFATTAISITQSLGRVDSARVYVRLKAGLPTGTYADSIFVTYSGAIINVVCLRGTVSAAPQVRVSTSSLSGLNYKVGAGPSAQQSFTVAGTSLSGNIVINPSGLFEISTTSGRGFGTAAITISQNYGRVDSARVYVRLKAGLPAGTYADSLLIVSNGADYKSVFFTGTVSVYGCMKSSAKNYNPLATIDDGSCRYDSIKVISGCTKKIALNYNPNATIDNGTCQYDSTKVISGCTDKKAINYNASATMNNGTCQYNSISVVYGCTDPTATNYNSYAKINNNNCIYKALIPGCTDSLALNYNSTASVNDGSCKYETKIWGCTDLLAQNYDRGANHNDGNCTYAQATKGCTDPAGLNYNPSANQEDGSCIYNQRIALGCIDVHALNYNPYANKDNGSCIYKILSDTIKGCTDPAALNYNPIAMQSDKSCIYSYNPTVPITGCMSPKALNYNDKAVVDDASCVFAKPMNLVTVTIQGATILADTLSKVQQGFCSFDYSIPIDTVYIVGTRSLTDSQVEVTWGIHQGGIETIVVQTYPIAKDGNTLLYLSLVCKNQPSGVKSAAMQSVKESASGTLNAITISSVLQSEKSPSGLTPIQSSNRFNVYPIPIHNEMHISYDAKENEDIQYSVFSIEGIRVSTGRISFATGQNQSVLNTSTWGLGMYVIQLTNDGIVLESQKFIKE